MNKKTNILLAIFSIIFLITTTTTMAKSNNLNEIIEYPPYCHIEGNNKICCTKNVCSIEIIENEETINPPDENITLPPNTHTKRHGHSNSNFMTGIGPIFVNIQDSNGTLIRQEFTTITYEVPKSIPQINLKQDAEWKKYMEEHKSIFNN